MAENDVKWKSYSIHINSLLPHMDIGEATGLPFCRKVNIRSQRMIVEDQKIKESYDKNSKFGYSI